MKSDISERIKTNKSSILIAFDSAYVKISDLHLIFDLPKKLIDSVVIPRIQVENTLHIANYYWATVSSISPGLQPEYHLLSEEELKIGYYYLFRKEKAKSDNLKMLYLSLEISFNAPVDPVPIFKALNGRYDCYFPSLVNSTKAFEFLANLQITRNIDKFFLYQHLIQEYNQEPFIFSTNSLNSFKNKLSDFKNNRIEAFFHKNKGNKNASIYFDAEDIKIIKRDYREGGRKSFRVITKDLNTNRILRGAKRVSLQTLISTIKNLDDYGELYLQRNGTSAANRLLLHPTRKQPYYPGDQYQIDGTRLNIPFLNDKGNADLLILVALIDVFSKKIVGYTLTNSETFQSYYKVICQAVMETKFLPAEILSDNLPALNSKESLNFTAKLAKFGVLLRRHTPLNPSDKSAIESWFGVFGQLYLKDVPGFLGDGIKSRRIDGKPNEDLIEKYKKKKNLRTRRELEDLLQAKIIEYNCNYEFKNSTPNLLFANSTAKNCIKLNEGVSRNLFYKEKVCVLSKAGITIQLNKKTYQYLIYGENLNFLLKFLNKEIRVRYDIENMDRIYIYTIDGDNPIIELQLHINFPLAQINQSEEDKIAIRQFGLKRYALKKQLIKICNKNQDEEINSPIIPMELISEKYDSKTKVNQTIKEHVLPRKKDRIKKTFKVLNKDNSDPEETKEEIIISVRKMFYLSGSNKLINRCQSMN